MECIRCKNNMESIGEYKFESKDNKSLMSAIFDIEKHLVFDLYVCSSCGSTEFKYKGNKLRFD